MRPPPLGPLGDTLNMDKRRWIRAEKMHVPLMAPHARVLFHMRNRASSVRCVLPHAHHLTHSQGQTAMAADAGAVIAPLPLPQAVGNAPAGTPATENGNGNGTAQRHGLDSLKVHVEGKAAHLVLDDELLYIFRGGLSTNALQWTGEFSCRSRFSIH